MNEYKPEREEKIARCVHCRSEFTADDLRGAKSCPTCGDTGQPLSLQDDVTITINWHELRILCSWAEKWGEHLIASGQYSAPNTYMAIYSIIGALQDQYPFFQPLSTGGELQILIRKGHEIN